MRTMCSGEIFTKKCWQQQIFDSDLKGAWHYNHVTFTPIVKNFMLYCRLIYMLSILYVILTIKVKVGIPASFKVGWYPLKKTGSSRLKLLKLYKRPVSIGRLISLQYSGMLSIFLRFHCLSPEMFCTAFGHAKPPRNIHASREVTLYRF